jgi:DNA-3-methyladenine glycosylase I
MAYHDNEWGVPLHDDNKLFEFMLLDAFQAGLSWKTILFKRENFRKAFDNFSPIKIANYELGKISVLMSDAGIIRNRLKIESTITNAKLFLDIQAKFGTFDKYIWQFTDGEPIINYHKSMKDIPASTSISDKMSKELKKIGFKFVGTTICYAFMQASGMVNDHLVSCFRHDELTK